MNWMAGAVKHPGALHRQLGVPAGKKIPASRLASAAAKGGTLGRRARLAQTFAKFRPRKKNLRERLTTMRQAGAFKGKS